MHKLLLVADIGGTKTDLYLLASDGSDFRPLIKQRYNSHAYPQFEGMLHEFITLAAPEIKQRPIDGCCLGIAGAVNTETAQVTNLPWVINSVTLQDMFGIKQIKLINDFAAIGYGIESLQQKDLCVLQPAQAVAQATRVVIGAGTGLGEGYLVWQGNGYIPLASEGGHTDFAPRNAIQHDLLRYLQDRFGHVSYERVVSGTGLLNIYEFLVTRMTPSLALKNALAESADHAATLTTFALQEKDALAIQVLNIFIDCYGAQAGNLALTCLARGGVYIAGGIAPKILARMQRVDFIQSFCDKGRFSKLMQTIPVSVVLSPDVSWMGAARVAMQLSQNK